jgi:class 3 adenylate cyclase/tetratricopeptide (TPR) repeat protein
MGAGLMTFEQLLDEAIAVLQRRGRVTYRALKRQLEVDDEMLADIAQELIRGQRLAADEDGEVLVWVGGGAAQPPVSSGAESPPAASLRGAAPSGPVSSGAARSQEAERRQLTVMFCDLVDSTVLAGRLDPEDLREVVREYQSTCADVIRGFDGQIAQLLGDGLLVYFGFPHAHEDDPQRAVHAGLRIVEAMRGLNLRLARDRGIELAVRIGVHTGLVVVGTMGGSGRQEELALGEVPNAAARLQGLAAPNAVVISSATHALVRGYFVCEDLGTPTLKGVAHPFAVFRVVRSTGAASRLDAAETHGLTPLVGRDAEVPLLDERWAQARKGLGQVVLIGGEAGIGKSRLARALKDHVASEPHSLWEGRCSPYTQKSALSPVVDLLQRFVGIHEGDAPAAKLVKLEAALGSLASPLGETVPLLAAWLSVPLGDRYSPPALAPERLKQRTFDVTLELMKAVAAERPLLFLFEDLHWADSSTLEWLGLVLKRAMVCRVLAVLVFRPEFHPPWPSLEGTTTLTLSRLPKSQAEELATRVAGGALPADVADMIYRRTDGVPLFVEELVRAMIETGALVEHQGSYGLTTPLSGVSIPATLRDLLVARLDRLGTAKETAQVAAAIGREFTFELLSAVTPSAESATRQDLHKLVAAELVYDEERTGTSAYMFKHALVRDAAYDSMLKRARRDVHARIAGALEARFPQLVSELPELVKDHYAGAGALTQAAHYALLAGRMASERSANKEAALHLRDGLQWVQTLEPSLERKQQELRLRGALAPVLMTTQGFASPELAQVLDGTVPLIIDLGDSPELFPLRWLRWAFLYNSGRYLDALRFGEENLETARRGGVTAHVVAALEAHGAGSMFILGRATEALAAIDESLALYDREQFRPYLPVFGLDQGVVDLMRRATILRAMGRFAAAEESLHRGLELAEQTKHVHSRCLAFALQIEYCQYLEDRPGINSAFAQLKPLCSEHGVPFWDLFGGMIQGWANLATEPTALHMLKAVSDGLMGFGHRLFASYWQYLMASGCYELGKYELGKLSEGLSHTDTALAFVEETQERWFEPDLWRIRAVLQAALGETTSAETSFRTAIAKAQGQKTLLRELRAALGLAEFLRSQGRPAEARSVLAPVCTALADEDGVSFLTQARELLATLPAA